MAFELLVETPPLLKEGHIVHFGPGWATERQGKTYRVEVAQQMEYDVDRIVSPGSGSTSYQDVSFDKPATGKVSNDYISLLPISPDSLFELLIGIKGLVYAYPRYNNAYFLKLEASGAIPDLTDADLAFLGFYDHIQTPYYSPTLREYTVKDMEAPVLRLYNPMIEDEKVILRFIVNRLKVKEIRDPSDQEMKVAREIRHFSAMKW
jgi:hypothetical protein